MLFMNVYLLLLALFIIIPLLFLFYAFFIEPNLLKKIKIEIKADKDISILFFSDIHLGKLMKKKRINKIFKKISENDYDIIIFGGDFFGKNFYKYYNLEEISAIFGSLTAKYKKIGVYGNHDNLFAFKNDVSAIFDKTDFQFLKNEQTLISKDNFNVKIYGFDELQYGQPKLVNFDLNPADFNIAVVHHPDYSEVIKNMNFDLILAGHSHGGQIKLFKRIYISRNSSLYYKGLYDLGYSKLIVSKGLGYNLIRARLMSRPDCVHIVVK